MVEIGIKIAKITVVKKVANIHYGVVKLVEVS